MIEANEITIEYEPESKSHYICWQPLLAIISCGATRIEALNNFKQAAHFFIDSVIDSRIRELQESN